MTNESNIWRNRIVGHGDESPDNLAANPANWREHPALQQDGMEYALGKIGWIQQVVVNRRTGLLIDGHLRVEIARRQRAATVPVLYVDLDEAEEKLALATLDPIGALATSNSEKLEQLLSEIPSTDDLLADITADLIEPDGIVRSGPDTTSRIKDGIGAHRDAQVRVVLFISEVAEFEQAMKETGVMNRGDALLTICREYLNAKRQQHAATQDTTSAPVVAVV